MATTRSTLQNITAHIDESMGVRASDRVLQLSPVPQARDIGRRPLRQFGRVDITQVIPDPNQPRAAFSQESLDDLAQSIREKGQLAPIRVRWSEELAKWIIVSGERRYRATKLANLDTIDCYFHDDDLAPAEILEQQLIENLLREDLEPIEEAKAFRSLMALNGWTGKQLSESLHIPPSRISRAVSLLRLPTEIQEQVESGELAPSTAYEISKLKTPDAQNQLANQVATTELTQAKAQRAVRQRRGRPSHSPRGIRLTFPTESGLTVTVTGQPRGNFQTNYHSVELALRDALIEVRHRLANGVKIF